MAQDYFGPHMGAMDRGYYAMLDSFGTIYHPTALHEDAEGAKTGMGPRELGMSNNPMQHQLIALQTKIREGASSVEFQFGGRQKGNSQASTPESYGNEEREAMRTLAEYNDLRTSTHATYTVSGLAGFGQNGFDKAQQHMVMEEVRRAVDFASQASTGGAVVVHTGEWQRPISEQPWARDDFKNLFPGDQQPNIRGYADEYKRATLHVVDGRTGEAITGIRKDQEIFEPKWVTAADYEKYTGRKLAYTDMKGNKIEKYKPFDYVDVDGRKIDPDSTEELFRRLPEWNDDTTNFSTQKLTWDDLVKRTDQYNEDHKSKPGFVQVAPEQLYAQLQIENQVLQARGSSLFHGQHYQREKKDRDALKKALELAETTYKDLPEDEKWKALRSHHLVHGEFAEFIPSETKDVRTLIQERIDDMERQMRYIHESSSAADVQAATLEARKRNIRTMEDYGLEQTGRALADLGVYAMENSKRMMENVKKKGGDPHKYEKLYIAPENVFPNEYGSHPDELMKIVEAGREQMRKELMDKYHKSPQEAQKIAAEHIKSTIDIGHLNMWKTHMKRAPGESEDQFNNRFEKWAMDKLEVMHQKGILGHFHLTDNLGFNDEHLTPGQGNAPIKAFVKKLESLGYKDFIIEPGSFNPTTAMGETWSYLGMQGFKSWNGGFRPGGRFTDIHFKHSAGYAPPNYIVGQYVPSNEWTLWSGTPLE